MNNLLQIIGSIILFGLFIILLLSFNANVTSVSHQTTCDKIAQESIVELIELFDFDFPKIGYQKPAPKFKPGFIDSTLITWFSDYNNDGSIDSIYYYLDTSSRGESPNPDIIYLYRKINNDNPVNVGLGIVYFNLSFYDSSATQIDYNKLSTIAGVKKIRGIKIRLQVESEYKYIDDYGSAFWEKTYYPRNIRI